MGIRFLCEDCGNNSNFNFDQHADRCTMRIECDDCGEDYFI